MSEKRDIAQEIIQGLKEISNGEVPSKEINIVKCKVCLELKTKIEAGKFPNGKIKKYTDEFGGAWNGKVCSSCNRLRMKQVMRAGRLGPKSEL